MGGRCWNADFNPYFLWWEGGDHPSPLLSLFCVYRERWGWWFGRSPSTIGGTREAKFSLPKFPPFSTGGGVGVGSSPTKQ